MCLSKALPASKTRVSRKVTIDIELIAIVQLKMCALWCVPADPHGVGFFALCGHRYNFSAASGGYLGPPFSLQFEPISCHGS